MQPSRLAAVGKLLNAPAPPSLGQRLRRLEQPMLDRVQQGALWLDLRSVVDFDGTLASLRELGPE